MLKPRCTHFPDAMWNNTNLWRSEKKPNGKSKMVWAISLEMRPNGPQLDIRCLCSVGESQLVQIWVAPGAECESRTTWPKDYLLMLLWLCLQDRVFCVKTCSRMALMSNTCVHTLVAASSFLWSKHDLIINKNSWWVLGLDEHLLTNLFLNCIVALLCKLFTWMKR